MNQSPRPPRWADRFLAWYCRPELLEEIQGDLYEVFQHQSSEVGERNARRLFVWNVLRSFRLSTIRNFQILSTMMIKSNSKIALRQMSRQKGLTAIKIGGFALGICSCLLIGLYIRDEISYDRHVPDAEQIYRVYVDYVMEDGSIEGGTSLPAPMARTLEAEYPEVEASGRINPFRPGSNCEVRRSDQLENRSEQGMVYADQSIIDIFQIPMVAGDSRTVLSEPGSIILSESKAREYFPYTDPIGQTLILNNQVDQPVKVTGVFKPLPSTSHLKFDFLLSLAGFEMWKNEQQTWYTYNYDVYTKLKPGSDPVAFEQKMEQVLLNHIGPAEVKEGYYESIDDLLAAMSLKVQPLKEIHLHSTSIHETNEETRGDIRIVRLFGAIAVFILILAAINFINLTTARSSRRAKEVGIRKVMGSERRTMVYQFLTESVLYSFFSFVLGLLLAAYLLPLFNQLSGKGLRFSWEVLSFWPTFLLAVLVVGVLSGLYPAFYLSRFKPTEAFRGKEGKGARSGWLQNGLVVFQFTTAVVLIISTLVIYRQTKFILTKDLGFDRDQVLVLQGTQTLEDKVPAFKERLLQLPSVSQVSASGYLPVSKSSRNANGIWLGDKKETSDPVSAQVWRVDHDYLQTFGLRLAEGRNFDVDMARDSQAVIINRALAERLPTDKPLGARITNGYFEASRPVIGIIEDFHFESLKDKIRPLCIIIGESTHNISVKASSGDLSTLIPTLTAIWEEFVPHQPLRYTFLDERFTQMYEAEQRHGAVLSCFTILAIVVACLGLFALSAFMADQRSKEISIRKVLGASVGNLFRLLTQSFLQLILLAFLIGIPLAWYLMKSYLQDYEYRIPLGYELFLFAGFLVVFIALATISRQAYKVSTANPVEAIRRE